MFVCVCVCACLSVIISLYGWGFLCTLIRYMDFIGILYFMLSWLF